MGGFGNVWEDDGELRERLWACFCPAAVRRLNSRQRLIRDFQPNNNNNSLIWHKFRQFIEIFRRYQTAALATHSDYINVSYYLRLWWNPKPYK